MATRFWVGGGSANTWAATGNTNWGTTSGVQDNASVPGIGDIAVFDGGSGTGNSVIGASITVQGLECDGSTLGTGAYGGTLTHNSSVNLTINTGAANSLRFSSGMTYTPAGTSSAIIFTHTTGTANIKCNGKSLAALNINGAGGTTQPLDTLNVTAVSQALLTLTAGTLDFNGGAGGPFAVNATRIDISPNNTRTLILGSTVTIGGNGVAANQNPWNAGNTGTLTFTKNSANIVVLANTINALLNFLGAGLTYNDVTFNATSAPGCMQISGANTFAHLNVGSGWSLIFAANVTQTISNAFSWAGTASLPMLVGTGSASTSATISCPTGNCTLTWGALSGITGAGGATFTATNSFNIQGVGNGTGTTNVGWTVTPPADTTAVLTAAQVTQLGKMIGAVAYGTVTTGASTTSVPTSALTFVGVAASGVVADEFKGRTILFSGDTTTAGLRGASSAISANTASNTPTFTVGTLPATPASGDTFSVI